MQKARILAKKLTSTMLLASLVFSFGLLSAPKAAKAAPGDIGFLNSAANTIEGDIEMVKFGPNLSLDEVEYVDVTYSVDPASTADASDFTFGTSHTVRITKDNPSIPLYLVDDNPLTEGPETLILTIDSVAAPAGAQVQVDPAHNTLTLTIQDNLSLPIVNFAIPVVNRPESESGSFTILLSRTSTSDIGVGWTVSNTSPNPADMSPQTVGGTVFPADFEIPSHETVIPAGQLSVTIPLNISNDTLFEDYETIELFLFALNDSVVGTAGELLYTINDAADVPTLSFEHAAASGDESNTAPITSLVLSNLSLHNTFVAFAPDPSSGTAVFGTNEDWDLATTTLLIPAAQTRLDVNLFHIYDDAEQEPAETAVVFIQSMQGAMLGQFRTTTYTILESDVPAPAPGTAIPQSTASEGGVPVVTAPTAPTPTTPTTPTSPTTPTTPTTPTQPGQNPGEVLGEQITNIDELIAKLTYGTTSEEVHHLQTGLKQLGFFPSTVKATKFYGPITKRAVEKYMDSKQWTLDQLVAMLRYNNRGTSVQTLQTQLRDLKFFPYWVRSTGWFGPITQGSVVKYKATK